MKEITPDHITIMCNAAQKMERERLLKELIEEINSEFKGNENDTHYWVNVHDVKKLIESKLLKEE